MKTDIMAAPMLLEKVKPVLSSSIENVPMYLDLGTPGTEITTILNLKAAIK